MLHGLFWRLQFSNHFYYLYINLNEIDPEEEYEKIYQFIVENELDDWSSKYKINTVKNIIQKVGLHKSLNYLHKLSILLCIGGKFTESLFESFIKLISQENIINIQEVDRINYLESNKINHLTTISIQSLSQKLFSLTGSSIFTKNEDEKKKSFRHLVQDESLFSNNIDKSLSKQNDQASHVSKIKNPTTLTLNTKNNGINKWNNKTCNNLGKNSPFEGSKLNEEYAIKNSIEYSDLAVSSYSISSGFFKDSFSDDDIPSPKYEIFEDISPNTNDEDYHMELYEKPPKFHKLDYIKKDKKHIDALKPTKKYKNILPDDAINKLNIKLYEEDQ